MAPVLTVAELRALDEHAPVPVEVLIDRAGRAVARTAIEVLGGRYGRRVVVVAGPGNNGADGRVAAAVLAAAGIGVEVLDVRTLAGPGTGGSSASVGPVRLPPADLVIDAAFGTGLRRPYRAPDPQGAPVVAVDIPSGIDGDTGVALGTPVTAVATVTFAAPSPGLYLGVGPRHAGRVVVADIGLEPSAASIEAVDGAWARSRLPVRPVDAHKWHHAVLVVAGGPGTGGAAWLAAAAAQRTGAGMVHVASPGVDDPDRPREAVAVTVDPDRWASELTERLDRFHAVVLGPGLGTAPATRHQIRSFVATTSVPLVLDADAITALGADAAAVLAERRGPTVLTPHDGELARLHGAPVPPGARLDVVRALASSLGAVVVSKGPTTVVAAPDGRAFLVDAGDARLATAGTGDVLSGVVAAMVAAPGAPDPPDAPAEGPSPSVAERTALVVHLHGEAGRRCPDPGTVASDVVAALPAAWRDLARGDEQGGGR